MALLSVIRRWHFRDQISIREIARRTHLSRNTVRKYLKSGELEPQYPDRKTVTKLSAFEPKLVLQSPPDVGHELVEFSVGNDLRPILKQF